MNTREEREAKFERIYKTKDWGVFGETLSGRGSSTAFVAKTIEYIKRIIVEREIESIVDICGDMAWQGGFLNSFPDVKYLGVDISETCLARIDKSLFGENVDFKLMDVCDEEPPRSDLFIARDVLLHLDENSSRRLLNNVKRSGTKWLLITSFRAPDDRTKYNLELPPFDFEFEEFVIENPNVPGYENKGVGLIRLDNLPLY